ncbi:KdsC family phosphatase [Enterovibrio norvegicus]|uniref:KdsC family phosphatase n=1 Tax=Enterovibrio norvegicus TaxID=188144 RepID=UPI0010BE83B6|nr:HAD-IIIA family hydrolase [Enterovibrio norvegicus]TKF30071.1 HAD-IIIA family hydrolase [Enterovibrio norvegicus]
MLTKELATNIKMVLLDVDGVMTDGSIFISNEGEAFKSFNVQDGLAIELLRSHNIKTGVVSGKASKSLTVRCQQLGFDIIVTGCKNKLPQIARIAEEYSISPHEIAFCGDDVLDIPVFDVVGLSVCPSDAHILAIESSDWIMKSKGGKGMVREFVDQLLIHKLQLPLKQIYEPLLTRIQNDSTEGIEQ